MNLKKVLAMALTVTTVFGTSALTVAAAPVPSTTEVTYNNGNIVPVGPGYGVQIDSGVNFTSEGQTIDLDMELQAMDESSMSELIADGLAVDVTVKSQNAMQLKLNGGTDPVDYELTYGGTTLDNDNTTANTDVALPDATMEASTTYADYHIEGSATLTGTAASVGSHKDVLTFTFTAQ